jgi:hypothetical protein
MLHTRPDTSLQAGDACPDGCGGKVYPQRKPSLLVRIKEQVPLAAAIYAREKLRCNLYGEVYTAAAPPEVGEKKYDESAAAMIALTALRAAGCPGIGRQYFTGCKHAGENLAEVLKRRSGDLPPLFSRAQRTEADRDAGGQL